MPARRAPIKAETMAGQAPVPWRRSFDRLEGEAVPMPRRQPGGAHQLPRTRFMQRESPMISSFRFWRVFLEKCTCLATRPFIGVGDRTANRPCRCFKTQSLAA